MRAIIIFLLSFATVSASTYYVDYATGSDSANGTTTSTPWKHCHGDPLATGLASSTTFLAGDTVQFKNDVSYVVGSAGLTLSSGSAASPITYDGSTWGAGTRAVITSNNVVANAFTDGGAAKSNVVITGFAYYNIGGYAETDPIWASGQACTIDITANSFATATAHGLSVGNTVKFTVGGGTFPTPLTREVGSGTSAKPYYVQSVISPTEFTISTLSGGSQFDLTAAGTGTVYGWRPVITPPGGGGVYLASGGSNVTISNCTFSEIGQWQPIIPMDGGNSVTGSGVALENNTGITISGCDFTRMANPVGIKSSATISDISVLGCTFHNYVHWLIDIAVHTTGATFRNILIDGCTFHDYKEFDSPNWQGFGEKPHQDGIFLRTTGLVSTWDNIVIRNSKFYSDQTSNGGTASIYVSQGPSVDIYNCLFLDDHNSEYIDVGFASPGMASVVRIWNNTFVGSNRGLGVESNVNQHQLVDIRNNAFFRNFADVVVTIQADQITDFTSDNNLFYGGNAARAIYDTTYNTLAAWQTKRGVDLNSLWADPALVSTSGNPSTWDARPTAGSPLIGAGQDLSAYFTTDITGATRTSWDIGAYAYSPGTGSAPTAPNTLAAPSFTTSSIDLTWVDTSSDETGFEIERSLDGSTGWTLIFTTASNATAYTDTSLSASTTYYYRVRAVNSFGNSSYTANASATTQAPPSTPVHARLRRGALFFN
jgi:hypothetical protein